MRVLLIFEFPSLNGGERSMLAVIESLRGRPIEFVALAPAEGPLKPALESRGVSVQPFDVRCPQGQRRPRGELLAELRERVAKTRCHLVHANSLAMGRLTGALAGELPIPTTAHLRDILKLSRSAVRELNGNARLVAVSHATREYHIAQGLSPERVLTIHNGVDAHTFQPGPNDGGLRRELGLSADNFLVLTAGQIGLRKGQDILAEAAEQVQSRKPGVHYLLAGQRCSNKEESLRFEEQVTARLGRLGQGDQFHLLGYRDDMPRLMNAVDVLVHPAHQEPLGRVLLEAAASGLAIIATDVGGTGEILKDGESTLLIPPADPRALADAIVKLAGDPELRNRLAGNARKRILARFQIQAAADNLYNLWHELFGSQDAN